MSGLHCSWRFCIEVPGMCCRLKQAQALLLLPKEGA